MSHACRAPAARTLRGARIRPVVMSWLRSWLPEHQQEKGSSPMIPRCYRISFGVVLFACAGLSSGCKGGNTDVHGVQVQGRLVERGKPFKLLPSEEITSPSSPRERTPKAGSSPRP